MALINGTAGDDNLPGMADADTINGLAGNDTMAGGGGADALDAGNAAADAFWAAPATTSSPAGWAPTR